MFSFHYHSPDESLMSLDRSSASALLRIAELEKKLVLLCHSQYEDPNGRLRYWESAERLSRHGDVDGVAIITLVRCRWLFGTLPTVRKRASFLLS